MATLTDRERELLALPQPSPAEAQFVDHVTHYAALGVGLATLCEAMYDGLMASGDEGEEPRFSRDEVLALVQAAVQGR